MEFTLQKSLLNGGRFYYAEIHAFFLQILRIKRLKQCTVIKLIVALESATAEYAVWSASNKSISTMPTCPGSIDFLHIIRTP